MKFPNQTALSNSIFSVIIRGDDSELIGMGRIIGDGGCFFGNFRLPKLWHSSVHCDHGHLFHLFGAVVVSLAGGPDSRGASADIPSGGNGQWHSVLFKLFCNTFI